MYVIKLKLSLPDKEKIGRFAIRTIRLLLICGQSVIDNFKLLHAMRVYCQKRLGKYCSNENSFFIWDLHQLSNSRQIRISLWMVGWLEVNADLHQTFSKICARKIYKIILRAEIINDSNQRPK